LASRNASFHERGLAGALLAPVKWLALCASILLGLIVAAWIVDWVMVFQVWPQGLTRLQDILRADLLRAAQLGSMDGEAPAFAVSVANGLYAVLFKLSGVHDMGSRFAEGAALSIPDTIARNTYLDNFEAIQVAMLATQVFGVRLALLLRVLPLFALAYCVALADGLTQRAIRRASGGRESASLYHRAKHLQVVLCALIGALGLLLPMSIDPRWIGLPGSLVLGALARVQWSYYKKHL